MVVLAAASGFAIGRHKPAHHYVSYFGYPMVLDTTTGKACYAAKPKAIEPGMTREQVLEKLNGHGKGTAGLIGRFKHP